MNQCYISDSELIQLGVIKGLGAGLAAMRAQTERSLVIDSEEAFHFSDITIRSDVVEKTFATFSILLSSD